MSEKERRKNKRLRLTLSIVQPIRLELHSELHDERIPGILVNLSAGGMALIVFNHLPEDSKIELRLDFMGVRKKMRGKIVREEQKFGDVYMVGVQFEEESPKLRKVVEDMAEDNDICEVRYVVNPETACFPKCSFRALCGRKIKKEFKDKGGK